MKNPRSEEEKQQEAVGDAAEKQDTNSTRGGRKAGIFSVLLRDRKSDNSKGRGGEEGYFRECMCRCRHYPPIKGLYPRG